MDDRDALGTGLFLTSQYHGRIDSFQHDADALFGFGRVHLVQVVVVQVVVVVVVVQVVVVQVVVVMVQVMTGQETQTRVRVDEVAAELGRPEIDSQVNLVDFN